MINTLINMADHEKVKVYRFEEIVTDKGGTKKVPVLKKTGLTVSIQTSGSSHNVQGLAVINTIAGKTSKAVYIVYSPLYKLLEKDLILREDGVIYEVQQVENNGRGTILQHSKYYIVEYDNQKVLKNELRIS